jgi:hypothetical protein
MTNKPAQAGIFLAGRRRLRECAGHRLRERVGAGFTSDYGLFPRASVDRQAGAIKEIG